MIWKEECLNIKNKLIEGFTNRYELDKLVYFEQFQFVNDAIKREKQLKN
jgi:putative endonuclease